MESESFEDEEVAATMNEHFVCIKVDREERPDIDQVYMEAVQMMSGQGGWPLNCFTTPDGIPIYGGTYFKKNQWKGVLDQLAKLWNEDPGKVLAYSKAVKEGMDRKPILSKLSHKPDFTISTLDKSVENWKSKMDAVHGGPNKAPKFPLPGSYLFLLNYAFYKKDDALNSFLNLTLTKMSRGGLYDQVGGGFTRYSTDVFWKVPHFEKMLYDNAQLIELYSTAFKMTENLEFKKTVEGTINWLRREMKDPTGGFYSAIDADSEGEEGRFYTWKPEAIPVEFQNFYETGDAGLWEGKIIPVRKSDAVINEQYYEQLAKLNEELLSERKKRIKPSVDSKINTSWNAMLAKALARASIDLGNPEYLDDSKQLMSFVENTCYDAGTGKLFHTITNGKLGTSSFLEDYAFLIDALIVIFEVSGIQKYAEFARELCHVAIDKFYDDKTGLFFFADRNEEKLVSNPVELSDNVIPATNSVMASNLFKLSSIFSQIHMANMAARLLYGVKKGIVEYGEGYFNWMQIWLTQCIGSPEIVITGPEAPKTAEALQKENFPLATMVFSSKDSRLEIFRGRFKSGKNLVHICKNHSCQLPQKSTTEAIKEIGKLVTEIQDQIG